MNVFTSEFYLLCERYAIFVLIITVINIIISVFSKKNIRYTFYMILVLSSILLLNLTISYYFYALLVEIRHEYLTMKEQFDLFSLNHGIDIHFSVIKTNAIVTIINSMLLLFLILKSRNQMVRG